MAFCSSSSTIPGTSLRKNSEAPIPAYRRAGNLGGNVAAGQVGIDSYRECLSYRIFEIDVFISTRKGSSIPQHFHFHKYCLTTKLIIDIWKFAPKKG
jgi:hypothetical protein